MQTTKFYYKVVKKSNSSQLIMFLHQLKNNSKAEKIVVILDNASIHKSKKLVSFLAKAKNIVVIHLPTYSPEYNPVERIWLFLKSNVLSRYIPGGIEAVLSEWRRFIWRWQGCKLTTTFNVGAGVWKGMV